TLEDTLQADLLLHVVDASSPMLREQMDEVQSVLAEIGADGIPQFLIYNKADLLPLNLLVTNNHTESESIEARASMPRFAVSALTGTGVASLKNALLEAVLADPRFQSTASALSDTTHIPA
ncbi:MAG: GTPase HflX, partial [Thiomonas sp.]